MTPQEIAWLKKDLAETKLPTVVFTHQRLDVDRPNKYAIKQSIKVREILEESKRVRVVFQGHSHKNELVEVNEIITGIFLNCFYILLCEFFCRNIQDSFFWVFTFYINSQSNNMYYCLLYTSAAADE